MPNLRKIEALQRHLYLLGNMWEQVNQKMICPVCNPFKFGNFPILLQNGDGYNLKCNVCECTFTEEGVLLQKPESENLKENYMEWQS
jgi:formate dehydrogenase maturation protein FdhE